MTVRSALEIIVGKPLGAACRLFLKLVCFQRCADGPPREKSNGPANTVMLTWAVFFAMSQKKKKKRRKKKKVGGSRPALREKTLNKT